MATLKEIMTSDVFATTPSTSVADVAASMLKGRFGSAVVLEGSTLMGIFTERDVLRAAAARADLTSSRVADWMTGDPVTASPDMDAGEATEIMMSQGFRHLPVVDGNTIAGIVSLRDILRTRIRRPPTT
jgi:CBS domain-containing protein